MVKLPALDKGVLPLQKLRDDYEHALIQILKDAGAEQVTLVLTKRLAALLTHVFVDGLGIFKKHHVVECMELTDDVATVSEASSIVYLSFAHVSDVRAVAEHAEMLLTRDHEETGRQLFLYVTGKWTTLCDQALNCHHRRSRFQTGVFPMGFVPLDTDLLTLGYQRCLYNCAVAKDTSALVDMAMALTWLQQSYGKFTSIKYKGEMAMLVLNHLMELDASGLGVVSEAASETGVTTSTGSRSRLDTLILLDRSVDFASVLSTPLTYEALLDEVIQIQDGFISVTPQILKADDSASDVPIPVALSSADEVFQAIRDKHIHTLPAVLNAQAVAIKQKFTDFQSASATATAAEVNEFVKTVPQMKAAQQAIEQHVNLLEHLEMTTSSKPFRELWQLERGIMDQADDALEAIEDLIFRHEELSKVLRLLCLYCVVNDGLTRRDLERSKLHLVRAYGHELLFSLDNLAQLRLLYERSPRPLMLSLEEPESSFQYVAKCLSVIDLEVNVKNPKNAAFVTAGYEPISCRLVEEILKNGHWRGLDHVMRRLPGPRAEVHLSETDGARSTDSKKKKSKPKRKPVVVVAFVGGVTFLEIAALRWIASFCKEQSLG
ncbi:hypothetical protein BBJ28_00012880 [Nothophytophthora sp. Chile5]|nr:hypothetical protein BBJ28_00012880 [Nothophytophthora sp. Chile5]